MRLFFMNASHARRRLVQGGAALAAVPALAALGGRPGAYLLCGLVCAGALALGALLMANAALGVAGLTGLARKALV